MKKGILIMLGALVIIAVGIFIYRYQIIQYSAENIIRKALPEYAHIDKITFNARGSEVILSNFKILNPSGFSDKYMIQIATLSCKYRMKGSSILDGFEIIEPVFKKPVINIERLSDGRTNLQEMGAVLQKPSEDKKAVSDIAARGAGKAIGKIKPISLIIKLPENFDLSNGKIFFTDRLPYKKPYVITFEQVNAKLSLKLNEDYSKMLSLASTGSGYINADPDQVVQWVISFNPTTPKLSMSNRFEVSNVDIPTFRPYYDKYSPFVFTAGRFSGELIFDFDNGSIGSSNEIHLSGIKFYVKPGYENATFWEVTVQDMVKYFTTPYGEIVFDFKIKGDMSEPRFYLGPISRAAITSMAIDKISAVVAQASGKSSSSSDVQKAKEYIDMFKGLMNKK